MRLVQTQQLEGSGIPCKSSQNICFEGHSFVRGVTFSNRLRHLANEIYYSEVASGNSCLIVEDETHFTIWHQESSAESEPVSQSEPVSTLNRVQDFVQDFVTTKRIKPLSPSLAKESFDRRPAAGNTPVMPSKDPRSQRNEIQPPAPPESSHQVVQPSSPVQSKVERQMPSSKTTPNTSGRRPRQYPVQHFSESAIDLWSSPYLDSLPAYTHPPSQSVSNYRPNQGGEGDFTRVWINLSQSE